ncbi:MAG: hypothetical protein CMH50_04485 [Myxococcales bacterium]|nr:hypothetical protein [Myxococcales bacterium]
MTSEQIAYLVLVGLVALQRLSELRLSAHHQTQILQAGGYEVAPEQMPWMRGLHTLWLVAAAVEGVLLMPSSPHWVVWVAGGALLLGQALRWEAISTLGSRWTVTIMILPEAPPQIGGLYGRIRHPNYLGVILEIAALPLLAGAWYTAVVFTLGNGVLLRHRIAQEEAALEQSGGYLDAFEERGRFVP